MSDGMLLTLFKMWLFVAIFLLGCFFFRLFILVYRNNNRDWNNVLLGGFHFLILVIITLALLSYCKS